MIIPTRRKMAFARAAFRAVMAARRLMGRGARAEVRRGGICWALDLTEGIEFAIYLTGAFEPATRDACQRYLPPGGVALDVGANMGAHTLAMALRVGAQGIVVAAEPTASAFRRLSRNLELNPNLAAAVRARRVMLVADDAARLAPALYASWPLSPDPRAHHRHLGVAMPTDGAVCRRLDDLVAAERLDRLDLVKIDVDGYELDVLEGARATLASYKPSIVFEFSPYTLQERGRSAAELLAILRDHGYDIRRITGAELAENDRDLIAGMPDGASINLVAVPAR